MYKSTKANAHCNNNFISISPRLGIAILSIAIIILAYRLDLVVLHLQY